MAVIGAVIYIMGLPLPRMVDRNLKQISKLIRSVKMYSHLYDSNHMLYYNHEIKRNTWQQIANNLETTVSWCEKNWNESLQRYLFEFRTFGNESVWLLFPQINFLEPYIDRLENWKPDRARGN